MGLFAELRDPTIALDDSEYCPVTHGIVKEIEQSRGARHADGTGDEGTLFLDEVADIPVELQPEAAASH
jgi:hypothetical protein